MLKKLDPLLHNELRLAIMSLLISVESAEFGFILESTKASKGNLSVQLNKLKDENYLEINKSFKNNYPLTTCKITNLGIEKFENYVRNISQYLKLN